MTAAVIRAGNPSGPREETSLLAFLSIILAHRRVIAICALAGTAIFGVLAASQADLYVSKSSFVVKGARAPVAIPGGAAALGITLSAYADFSQSVSFYADLSRAMNILRIIAAKDFVTEESGGRRIPLPEAMGIKAQNRVAAIEEAALRLSKSVSYSISSRTGVVRLSVEESDALLAQQINANILTELDTWSKEQGHAQAVLERRFMDQAVADARAKLSQAEQSERSFLELNRLYQSSPQLRLEYNRRFREVEMRQQIYTALAQTLEQARIEEVRRPTLINVIESADLPVEPQRREALRNTLTGLAAGLLVGMVLAVLRQRVSEKETLA
ncbi:MAG TPA: GNVR domain-containing protein [Gemmatimonadaceae bacterium]